MAELVVFHHAQGRTTGMADVADQLRTAGHIVHLPDLYERQIFDTLDEGVEHADSIGFSTVIERGTAAVDGLPNELVYVGFSLGVLPAQRLAQTRAGAKGAVLVAACVDPEAFGGPWPDRLPLQVHGMLSDPFFAGEGDLDVAKTLVEGASDRELITYPGADHLFADSSLADHDPASAEALITRVLSFLAEIDSNT